MNEHNTNFHTCTLVYIKHHEKHGTETHMIETNCENENKTRHQQQTHLAQVSRKQKASQRRTPKFHDTCREAPSQTNAQRQRRTIQYNAKENRFWQTRHWKFRELSNMQEPQNRQKIKDVSDASNNPRKKLEAMKSNKKRKATLRKKTKKRVKNRRPITAPRFFAQALTTRVRGGLDELLASCKQSCAGVSCAVIVPRGMKWACSLLCVKQ